MYPYFLFAIGAAALAWLGSFLERKLTFKYKWIVGILFLALAGLVFCFFAGARGMDVGADIKTYVLATYDLCRQDDPAAFFDSGFKKWAPLIKVLLWAFAQISPTIFWFLFFIELMIIVPVLFALRLVLKDKAWMGIFVFGILFFPYSLNMMRQFVAMGFILLSYPFIRDKKIIPFVLCIIVAGLLHDTAFIALLALPVYLIGVWRRGNMVIKLVVLGCFTVVGCLAYDPVMNLIQPLTGYYTGYTIGSLSWGSGYFVAPGLIILCLGLAVVYYLCLKRDNPEALRTPEISGLAFLVFFGAAVFAFCMVSIYMYRIGTYFLYFVIFLLPMAYEHLHEKIPKAIFGITSLIGISGFSICYYAITLSHEVVPYVFA